MVRISCVINTSIRKHTNHWKLNTEIMMDRLVLRQTMASTEECQAIMENVLVVCKTESLSNFESTNCFN